MGVQKFKRSVLAPSFEGTVVSGDLPTNAVGTANIQAQAVTYAKSALFIANGETGTGSSQNIAHGLGVVPSKVFIAFEGSTSSQAVTYGTHTTTNVVVTVTNGAKFSVFAMV